MGVDGKRRSCGKLGSRVLSLAAVLLLAACAGAQPASYAAVTCKDSLPSSETGPYRPGVVCLAYGESPTTGARSGAAEKPPMKAISVDGRVFFVNAQSDMPPEALLHR